MKQIFYIVACAFVIVFAVCTERKTQSAEPAYNGCTTDWECEQITKDNKIMEQLYND